ncbi:methylated-DNA--[protein]-cysteine S-methyltransferase [Treponema lecithinolyticum]|uniref:Methylated-DNA--protein-cysteine methyltransferase n=1 Tax=Treponema lecithinolyticum ATCC 700332 TaxID=1321815 RepID=A0ABN0NYK3_TRELE|nr:methylated-DNA--[protein]-cysteine S-methyltransferase [Treponema lecithinolyticum]ERJ93053.1 6-O-methylguanine DNA methyltransferase, DNA binding domain protein [Treponema lecithinolyticum ATCC 700332]
MAKHITAGAAHTSSAGTQNEEQDERGETPHFAVYPSKFGLIRIDYKGSYITGINRVRHTDRESVSDTAMDGKRAPGCTSSSEKRCAVSDNAFKQINEYFEGKRKTFDFLIKAEGTDFQKKVWRALCDIPYGETRTYKEIAQAVGSPKACRAVGMANNRNPISFAVPCHRVIGADGSLVGYGGGLDLKHTLLQMERNNKEKS